MRDLRALDAHRLDTTKSHGWNGDGTCGGFSFPSPIDGQPLNVIASSGDGWDHVSVSRRSRCPNWPEMEFIKRKFFRDDEAAMQLHVPESEHINVHPYTLHIWRPQQGEIPRPPGWMVGPIKKAAARGRRP
jgi:hypothetical protein